MFDVKRLDVFRRNNWDTLNFHQVTDVFPLLLVQSHGINEITQVCIDTNLIQLTKKGRQLEGPIIRHDKTSRSLQVWVNFFRKLMVKLLSRYGCIKQQLLQLLITASARSSSKLSCSFSSTSSNSGPHFRKAPPGKWKCTHFLNWVSHHCRSWRSPSPDTKTRIPLLWKLFMQFTATCGTQFHQNRLCCCEGLHISDHLQYHADHPEIFKKHCWIWKRWGAHIAVVLASLCAAIKWHSSTAWIQVLISFLARQDQDANCFFQVTLAFDGDGKVCGFLIATRKKSEAFCQKKPKNYSAIHQSRCMDFHFQCQYTIYMHIYHKHLKQNVVDKSTTLSCRHIPGHPLDRPPYPPLGRRGSSVAIPLSPQAVYWLG